MATPPEPGRICLVCSSELISKSGIVRPDVAVGDDDNDNDAGDRLAAAIDDGEEENTANIDEITRLATSKDESDSHGL